MWTAAGERISRAGKFSERRSRQRSRALSQARHGQLALPQCRRRRISRLSAQPACRWAAGPGRAMPGTSITTAFPISTSPMAWSPAPRATISTASSGGRWSPIRPPDAKPSPDYEQGWTAINELIRSDGTWSGYERNVFYANNRDGTFSDVSGAIGLDFVEDGRSFALADFDHDGRQEVFLKNRNAPAVARPEERNERPSAVDCLPPSRREEQSRCDRRRGHDRNRRGTPDPHAASRLGISLPAQQRDLLRTRRGERPCACAPFVGPAASCRHFPISRSITASGWKKASHRQEWSRSRPRRRGRSTTRHRTAGSRTFAHDRRNLADRTNRCSRLLSPRPGRPYSYSLRSARQTVHSYISGRPPLRTATQDLKLLNQLHNSSSDFQFLALNLDAPAAPDKTRVSRPRSQPLFPHPSRHRRRGRPLQHPLPPALRPSPRPHSPHVIPHRRPR